MSLTVSEKLETSTYVDTDSDASAELVTSTDDKSVFGFQADNTQNSVDSYLKLYNSNAAANVGTDIPVFIARLPAGEKRKQPIGSRGAGYSFSDGISFAVVTDPGTGGTTAPTNDVEVVLKTD